MLKCRKYLNLPVVLQYKCYGKWNACRWCFSTLADKALYGFASYSAIYTYTNGSRAAMLGAGQPIESNSEFSISLKDTSTHGQKEPGINPQTLGLMDNLLYLLTQSETVLLSIPQRITFCVLVL